MCAKLRRSLYGARAAPARWEALRTETRELRVRQGQGKCVLLLQRRVGREVRRARGRLNLYGLRHRLRRCGEADGREVYVQNRGAPRWRPVGLAGGEAADPHHPMDAGRAPV
eukprot:8253303-Alexandrium_andersonii.AAC.1